MVKLITFRQTGMICRTSLAPYFERVQLPNPRRHSERLYTAFDASHTVVREAILHPSLTVLAAARNVLVHRPESWTKVL